MDPKVTIKDIAERAGVSATAVSMALNDRPGVSLETRQNIVNIAREMGYHPNIIARGLINRRTYTIGFVLHNIADPLYPEIVRGIEEKANELGYSLLLSNAKRGVEGEKAILDALRNRGVDGLIIATASIDDPNLRELVDDRFPFILINRHSLIPELERKTDYVVLDNYMAGYLAIRHLYRLGHNRISVLTGDLNMSTAHLRTKGCKKAMEDMEINPDPKLIVQCGFIPEEAARAANVLLDMEHPPTAFFAQDDLMAIAVREVILRRGKRIPEDIALVGVDDVEMSSLTGVELTTISQKNYQMGTLGAEMLINKIEQKAKNLVTKVVLEAELAIRKSCGFHLNNGYVR